MSTGTLSPAFDPATTVYTVSSLTSLAPIVVTLGLPTGATATVNGVAVVDGKATLTLAPREDIVATVVNGSSSGTYTVKYVPDTLPAWSVSGTPGGSEVILTSPQNMWLLATDRSGAPLYYRTETSAGVGDFEQHVVDGTTYYTFLRGDPSTTVYSSTMRGTVRVMNAAFHDVADLALLPNRDHGALPADVHDFLILGDQHYVLMAYVEETHDVSSAVAGASTAALVYANVVQEIDHGQVVFEWSTADVPSLYADTTEVTAYTSTTTADYAHLNAVQVDPLDQNLLVSLRHTNSVLKLDRTSGKVLWTLGGKSDAFGLTEAQRFSHQHHVRRQPDGSLLLFDNGNGAHPTRTLSFRLDEAAKKVTDFAVVYEQPVDRPQSTYMGSIFDVSGTRSRYVIGWGGFAPTDPMPPAVTEIVDGVPVWQLTFAKSSLPALSYRAQPVTLP